MYCLIREGLPGNFICCCWLAPEAFDEGHSPLTPTPLFTEQPGQRMKRMVGSSFLVCDPHTRAWGGWSCGAVRLGVSDLPKVTSSRQSRLHTSPLACSALTATPCTNQPFLQENRTRDKCMRYRCVVFKNSKASSEENIACRVHIYSFRTFRLFSNHHQMWMK